MPLNESDKNENQNNLFDDLEDLEEIPDLDFDEKDLEYFENDLNLKYKINDTGDGVIITKYVNNDTYYIRTSLEDESIVAKDDTEVVIPTEINGLPVTTIGDCAFQDDYDFKDDYGYHPISLYWPLYERSYDFEDDLKLQSISIPKSVKITGNAGCRCLTSIVIPNSVTNIGNSAFYGCTSLQSINIPESVTTIGNSAFACCESLTSIVIPEGVTSICDGAFYGCKNLRSIKIPESVTYIGVAAFYGCTNLQSINIPEGVTSIGDWAFKGCTSLTSINIPESVTTIGNHTFQHCWSLQSVELPEGVTTIGEAAFENCSGLTRIKIPDGVTEIGDGAFYCCSKLQSINIPEKVTYIGVAVFYGCRNLESIKIPEGVTSIGDFAFKDCESLTSIDIPNGVTTIGDYVFRGCNSLTNIKIPKGVTTIGERAFYGCTSLQSIDISEGIKTIGKKAFAGCTGLTSIEIPEGITKIAYVVALDSCRELKRLIISATIQDSFDDSFDDNVLICNINDTGNGVIIKKCFSDNTEIVIPSMINNLPIIYIDKNTFEGCKNLKTLIIPNTIQDSFEIDNVIICNINDIGDGVNIKKCVSDDTEVVIPSMINNLPVTDIDKDAFDGCKNLKTLIIPNTIQHSFKVDILLAYRIHSEYNVVIITKCVSDATEVVIPSIINDLLVADIDKDAFDGCKNLKTLIIPNTIQHSFKV